MQIVYLYQYFATRQNVGHTRAYEFARRFAEEGHEVTVVTARSGSPGRVEEAAADGLRVAEIPAGHGDYIAGTRLSYRARIGSFLAFCLNSARFLLTDPSVRRADVLYASSPPLTVALPALAASYLLRIPLVFEVRDPWPEAPIQMGALKNPLAVRLARLLERLAYRRSRRVVALSPGMRDLIVASTPTPAEKVVVVPNCCDLDLFRPDVSGAGVRERLGLGGAFVCLYFGAMGEANGLHAVLDSAALLKGRAEQVVIVLCGDGKEKEGLERRAQDEGLTNVRFAPAVPKQEIPEVVAAADVCLTHFKNLPVLYTCSPNKLFDAIAAGKPVVVNTPGWTKALLEDHRAGFYADPTDPASLADLLARLSRDPELVRVCGLNARALAEAEFSRDVHAGRLLGVLRAAARGG